VNSHSLSLYLIFLDIFVSIQHVAEAKEESAVIPETVHDSGSMVSPHKASDMIFFSLILLIGNLTFIYVLYFISKSNLPYRLILVVCLSNTLLFYTVSYYFLQIKLCYRYHLTPGMYIYSINISRHTISW
jgi:hypothetical protein